MDLTTGPRHRPARGRGGHQGPSPTRGRQDDGACVLLHVCCWMCAVACVMLHVCGCMRAVACVLWHVCRCGCIMMTDDGAQTSTGPWPQGHQGKAHTGATGRRCMCAVACVLLHVCCCMCAVACVMPRTQLSTSTLQGLCFMPRNDVRSDLTSHSMQKNSVGAAPTSLFYAQE